MDVALICLSAAPCFGLKFRVTIGFALTIVTTSLDAAGTGGLSNGVPIVKNRKLHLKRSESVFSMSFNNGDPIDVPPFPPHGLVSQWYGL